MKSSSPVEQQKPSAPVAPAATERRLTLAELMQALVDDGVVELQTAEQFMIGKRYWRGTMHPLAVIAEQRWKSVKNPHQVLDIDTLSEWLARWSGLEYFHIDPLKVDFAAVTEVVSNAYATRFGILPVQVRSNEVVIATTEPFLKEWQREIEAITRKSVRRVIANPDTISRCQVEFYSLAKSVKRAMQSGNSDASGVTNFEQLVELGAKKGAVDANDQHIITIVDWLWQYAFDQRASDIHIEPRRDIGVVRFRIDGVLHQVYQIPTPVLIAMTSRIKILGRMDVVEKRRPQDGRVKTRMPDGTEVELRLATLPTAFGEKLVMRIFDPEVLVRDFSELGFPAEDEARWKEMTSQPNGIVLVTGPTGSGKTTTLYSTLKLLATQEVNLCTLEDPIEMIEPSFNQTQVQAEIGVTFASGIRALMRQDPDIIMVGEIRDLETAEMAIQAALTGHLVLSTLHTNDAPTAITRLLDLGVPGYLLNSTIIGVMAQRLVRTLCPHCKKPQDLSEEDGQAWDAMVSPWRAKRPAKIHHPVGCLECRMTGYMGRVGLYELLPLSLEIKKLVGAEANLDAIRTQAVREGLRPLRLAGAMKVAQGITTIEEVLKVSPHAEAS